MESKVIVELHTCSAAKDCILFLHISLQAKFIVRYSRMQMRLDGEYNSRHTQ